MCSYYETLLDGWTRITEEEGEEQRSTPNFWKRKNCRIGSHTINDGNVRGSPIQSVLVVVVESSAS